MLEKEDSKNVPLPAAPESPGFFSSEILEGFSVDITGQDVVLVGRPGSGKTTFSQALSKKHPKHTLISTDDFMHLGYEQSMYAVLGYVKEQKRQGKNVIVEGVQGPRLLRKGAEQGTFIPGLIIELTISDKEQAEAYASRGGITPGVLAMNKNIETVLSEYKEMEKIKYPNWVSIRR